jgi:Tfp pilus assembly protein PilN
MIEINLLPEELKVKTRSKNSELVTVKKGASLNQDKLFIYAIPVVLALCMLVNFYFVAVAIYKNSQLISLNRKWLNLEPQKKILDEFNTEFYSGSQNAAFAKLLTSQRILWAQKLNKLSLNLPSGIWFNDLAINGKNITIQGSVISLQKEEVSLVNMLLDKLKKDADFSQDFSSFELSNMQNKNIGGYDIADFVLVGALKSK